MMSLPRRRSTLTLKDHRDDAFPSAQLFVLAVCRICEPIAFMSIFPYIYYMVQTFDITQNDNQIALYAGMVTSAFAFAECLSSVFWGRLSDRVGRKPVLLTGLAGTGISMLMFGFATNLPLALVARFLGGVLNGNIGVLQTTVAEVVTVEAHQPRAYSIMPVVWCLGSVVGSGLGGTLVDPVKNYPGTFLPGTIFDRFPCLLPNLVCAAVALLSLTVGLLFLEETHEDKQHRKDYGLELGKWILNWGRAPSVQLKESKLDCIEETLGFLADEQPPDYPSTRPSTSTFSDCSFDSETVAQICCTTEKPSFRKAFTKQVVLNIIGYGIVAFHTISFEQLMPVLLNVPPSDTPPSLPFKFTGGFGLSTKTIGFILSFQGFCSMLIQIFIFPAVSRKFGSLMLFRATAFFWPLVHFFVPYLALLPENFGMAGIFIALAAKVAGQSFMLPSLQILLANTAPSKKVLGTLNGAAASSATFCRALGPLVSGLVYSQGVKLGYSGLAWWFISLVAIGGAIESMSMTGGKRKKEMAPCTVVIPDEASLLVEQAVDDSSVSPEIPGDALHPDRRSSERRSSYGSMVEAIV